MSIKPFAFVLMPFSSDFDDVYKLGIKKTCLEQGFIAERVDEQKFNESILERIYKQISSADLIIADMTGQNPNVFYEVGYAHAQGKQCVLLTSSPDDIPFDLKHHRHIIYNGSISMLAQQLEEELTWCATKLENNKGKTISASLKRVIGNLVLNDYAARGDVDLDINLKNVSSARIKEVEAIYLHTGEGWEFKQDGVDCAQDVSNLDTYKIRHFIKSPINSLSKDAWAPLKMSGRKYLAWTIDGDELQDTYEVAGHITIEVMTSEGAFLEKMVLNVMFDEIPF